MSTADALIAEWEAVLARENLRVIDAGANARHDVRGRSSFNPGWHTSRLRMSHTKAEESLEAASCYLAWASSVLETVHFAVQGAGIPSPDTRRRAWTLHAEGATLTAISEQLSISRQSARIAITTTKNEARDQGNPPPVLNPWAPGVERQKQETDMKPQQPRQPVEYAAIRLGRPIKIPGRTTSSKDIVPYKVNGIVKPLYGIPHALGIDVEFDTEHVVAGQKRQTKMTITIPAWKIEQAEQMWEEVEAA